MRSGTTLRHGSVLILVTLALIPMFGVAGLAIDMGWAFYVKRTAQAAADTAAIAAAKLAMDGFTGVSSINCARLGCTLTGPQPCPAVGGLSATLNAACQYAQRNGFDPSANSRQSVTVQAADAGSAPPTVPSTCGGALTLNSPPTAPCVNTYYWVTVRVSEQIPQLFSRVLGFTDSMVSARATAAIVEAEMPGSLFILNRENDPGPNGTGINLYLGGGPTVNVPGGIILDSNKSGPANFAGYISGNGVVTTPHTWTRGSVSGNGGWIWNGTIDTGQADGTQFGDPMTPKVKDYGQPPVDTSGLARYGILNGQIKNTSPGCSGGTCQPGIYYATDSTGAPTGQSLQLTGNINFAGNGPFGTYILFGGLNIGSNRVNFGPGEYVLAGTIGTSDNTRLVWSAANNASVTGGTAENSDAGRLFIMTDGSYGGVLDAVHPPGMPALGFGGWVGQSGNNASSTLQLFGIDPYNSSVPPGLTHYGPIVLWQDMRNSTVKYDLTSGSDTYGGVDTSCGSVNSPCTTGLPLDAREKLEFWAGAAGNFGGVIYQPRGAYAVIHATPTYSGPLRVVTGSMNLQGNGQLTLTGPKSIFTQTVAALVE